MKRNPHPARRTRIATLGFSATAFASIVTSLTWNTHLAELAASSSDVDSIPVEQLAPVGVSTTTVAGDLGTSNPSTPAATIAPTAPTAPTSSKPSSAPSKPAKGTNTSAPAQQAAPAVPAAPATPEVAPAAPTTPAAQPAAPAAPAAPATPEAAPAAPAPTVVYTCMSPGGKTENPTSTGKCKNAKYGYVLTQI